MKHRKAQKGEVKANWLQILKPKNDVAVSSLGFLLASYIPDLVLEKLATQKCQKVQTKTVSKKVHSF